eukprot:scaffold16368_cov73-Cyclotella_meneghiniana.AAC.2
MACCPTWGKILKVICEFPNHIQASCVNLYFPNYSNSTFINNYNTSVASQSGLPYYCIEVEDFGAKIPGL